MFPLVKEINYFLAKVYSMLSRIENEIK